LAVNEQRFFDRLVRPGGAGVFSRGGGEAMRGKSRCKNGKGRREKKEKERQKPWVVESRGIGGVTVLGHRYPRGKVGEQG